jgi:hypothetical protein
MLQLPERCMEIHPENKEILVLSVTTHNIESLTARYIYICEHFSTIEYIII